MIKNLNLTETCRKKILDQYKELSNNKTNINYASYKLYPYLRDALYENNFKIQVEGIFCNDFTYKVLTINLYFNKKSGGPTPDFFIFLFSQKQSELFLSTLRLDFVYFPFLLFLTIFLLHFGLFQIFLLSLSKLLYHKELH